MSARWILVSLGLGALSMSSCSYDWTVSDSAQWDGSETSSLDASDDDASLFEEAGATLDSGPESDDDASLFDDAGAILDSGPESDDGELGPGDAEPTEAEAEVDAAAPCYLDRDGDGVGAGPPTDCSGADAGDGALVVSFENNDCDDSNAQRSPRLTDVCGDEIDNDCDGMVDDESNNACGGACIVQLGHQPGTPCTNGLLGACARPGKYVCQGDITTLCDAPSANASGEVCGDGIDNDCDGRTDEEDAIDATVWYPDCDGDGYSALSETLIAAKVGLVVSCVRPRPPTSCAAWTGLAPTGASSRDCDDTSSEYRPGATFGLPPEGKTSTDLNCDGTSEKEPAIGTTLPFASGINPVMYCSAGTNCTSCVATGGQGQWLASDNTTPTDIQPACSTGFDDRRPWRSIDWVNNIGRCYMNRYSDNYWAGWQRCR